MTPSWEEGLDAVSVLVDPVRRSMYGFVREAGRPVSREEVAEATGTSVKLAAFHLDRLVAEQWLQSRYDSSARPPSGGRPPKQYEPSEMNVMLSLPARRYDLMAEILLEASGHDESDFAHAVRRAAYDRGRTIAEASRGGGRRRRMGAERTLAALVEQLRELGFEPHTTPTGELITANCPFRSLAQTAPDTVCDAARALAEGLVTGLGGSGVAAAVDRDGDRCCVAVRRSPRREA